MVRWEHKESGGEWRPVDDADDLAHRLFVLGGQGRAVLETRGGEYFMTGGPE